MVIVSYYSPLFDKVLIKSFRNIATFITPMFISATSKRTIHVNCVY